MTIYLDVVFFMNLLYQLGILAVVDLLFHMGTSKWRIFAGAVIGSILYCGCIVLEIPVLRFPINVVAGVLIGIISILIAFVSKARKKLCGLILAEIFLSLCLGGILELMPGGTVESYLLTTGAGALIFMGLFCVKIKKLLIQRVRNEKSICKVKISHKGRLAYANGLVDTGNSLTDPISGEPVIIIQKSLREKILLEEPVTEQKGYRLIPYGSIGIRKGILEAFRLEQMEISNKTQDGKDEAVIRTQVICAVYEGNYSTNGAYEVILHPHLL